MTSFKKLSKNLFSTFFYLSFVANFFLLLTYVVVRIYATIGILHEQGYYGWPLFFKLFEQWEYGLYHPPFDSPFGMISIELLFFVGSLVLLSIVFSNWREFISIVKVGFDKLLNEFPWKGLVFLVAFMTVVFLVLRVTPAFFLPLEKLDTYFGHMDENNFNQLMLFRWNFFDYFGGRSNYGFDFSAYGGLYKYYLLFVPVFFLLRLLGDLRYIPILNFVTCMYIYFSILNVIMTFLLLIQTQKKRFFAFLFSFTLIITIIIFVFTQIRMPELFGFSVIHGVYFYSFLGALGGTYLFTLLILSLVFISQRMLISLKRKVLLMFVLLAENVMLLLNYYHIDPLFYFVGAISLPFIFGKSKTEKERKLNFVFFVLFFSINQWGIFLNQTQRRGIKWQPPLLIVLTGLTLFASYFFSIFLQKNHPKVEHLIRKYSSWYTILVSFFTVLFYLVYFYGVKYFFNYLSVTPTHSAKRTILLELLFLSLFLSLVFYFTITVIFKKLNCKWLILILVLMCLEYYLYNFHEFTTSVHTGLDNWFASVSYDLDNPYFYDQEYKVRVRWNEYYIRAIRFLQQEGIKKRVALLGEKFSGGEHEAGVTGVLISDRNYYLEGRRIEDEETWLEEVFPGGAVAPSTREYFSNWILITDNRYYKRLLEHLKNNDSIRILYSNKLYRIITIE